MSRDTIVPMLLSELCSYPICAKMGSTVKIGVMTISSSKCDQTATDDGHDARPEKQSYERQIVIFF